MIRIILELDGYIDFRQSCVEEPHLPNRQCNGKVPDEVFFWLILACDPIHSVKPRVGRGQFGNTWRFDLWRFCRGDLDKSLVCLEIFKYGKLLWFKESEELSG